MMILDFISENRTLIAIISITLLALFLLFGSSFVLVVLILASLGLSYFMGLWKLKSIGIELVLLISVITGMSYGSVAGAIIAFLLIIIHMIATQHVNVYLLWVIPGYAVVGYLAGSTELSITSFGLLAALGLNAFNLVLTALIFRVNVAKFMPFALTNVIFNAALFLYVAPLIISLA